jgi:hypothetical protein
LGLGPITNNFESVLQIIFKSPEFFPIVFQQQLTILDFVSHCGGSLGLFLGISAISAVEVIYYFTLRLCCLRNTRKQVEPDEEIDGAKKKNYFIEIMDNSSIHGANQIFMSKRHLTEKFV